ncbi:hypothetical protein Pelo_13205 [Pelomyxa schiedti]|nr:hypothetical protein Pelo_13205 [Pelomyxa schiedti]
MAGITVYCDDPTLRGYFEDALHDLAGFDCVYVYKHGHEGIAAFGSNADAQFRNDKRPKSKTTLFLIACEEENSSAFTSIYTMLDREVQDCFVLLMDHNSLQYVVNKHQIPAAWIKKVREQLRQYNQSDSQDTVAENLERLTRKKFKVESDHSDGGGGGGGGIVRVVVITVGVLLALTGLVLVIVPISVA